MEDASGAVAGLPSTGLIEGHFLPYEVGAAELDGVWNFDI
jgi:hypothetical protein